MSASWLPVVAVFAPLLGSLAVLVRRPQGLGAGRLVTVACGIAFVAAIAVAVVSASRTDGLVDGVGGGLPGVDRASALLLAAVTGTGVVVGSFARRNVDLDPRGPRFFVLFGILVTGSALVATPGGWWALVVGWIGATWALLGLVGHRCELAETRRAQRSVGRALVVGDLALVAAVAITLGSGDPDPSRDLAAVMAELGSDSVFGIGVIDIVAVLLVVAGASRSALVPFHRWLVSTLAAPTPVSALVHAGFVSGAGLLLIRFAPIMLGSAVAVHLAFALAAATVVVALVAGSSRVDVKGTLAWSTVSQMGFMVVQCAVGALSSAVFHIIGHGMYKASMFLGAGDAVSAGLRVSRRAPACDRLPAGSRAGVAAAVATLAVGLGWWILPPDVSDAGVALIVVFAWVTTAQGVWGWLGRGPLSGPRAVATATVGGVAAVFVYLAGLRLVERFVEPSFVVAKESGVELATLLVTIGVVATGAAVIISVQHPAVVGLRERIRAAATRTAHPGVAGTGWARGRQRNGGLAVSVRSSSPSDDALAVAKSKVRADIARAARIVAPSWPVTSFVAVNPLGGLEHLGFDEATAVARRQLRSRTHLSLEEFRRDHEAGRTTLDDVQWAIESQLHEVCSMPPLEIRGRRVAPSEIVRLDLFHGPDRDDEPEPLTALERVEGPSGPLGQMIDASIAHSAAQFAAGGGLAFGDRWLDDAVTVAALRHHLSSDAHRWLRERSSDPAEVITDAFGATGVDPDMHVSEMRGHLGRMLGWAGYAKWRADWAHSDDQRRAPTLLDLVAARSALEAACLLTPPSVERPATGDESADGQLEERIDAVAAAGFSGADRIERDAIGRVLSQVHPRARHGIWLRAQERHVEQQLLSQLERLDPGTPVRAPEAQLVFCIDVRSEGLRRHLEATGPYDTLGFAGFFGVAVAVRRLQWDHHEPRCPVLVAPSMRAVEHPVVGSASDEAVDRMLARDRVRAGATAVHASTKYGPGAAFVMAEGAGWVAGPVAAARTLSPPRRSSTRRPATVMELETRSDGDVDLDQRVFTAEAVLRTMGLAADFAPLVVLCGHASHNVNNPHATSLDCGACAGASGEDNARTVARLLNDPDVRAGLREREIDIPDATHFAAGLHDTVSDHVEILDHHAIPTTHHDVVARLVANLDDAARSNSSERGRHLPGPADRVRDRGNDWAQVRPEWGLARNSSFIVGPRSMTAGLDLDGRSFLHTYDAARDPDGKVLETIMTAPLVVGHWISSQYYFSTVDPETFGAGDKLIHNVVGNTGVVSGEHGDLRVGLPLQSTHVGTERHHQPVRLLAVIQAPLERIERIIDDNAILTTLVGGSWIRIAARSHPHERWSIRTPDGTWSTEPLPIDTTNTLETP